METKGNKKKNRKDGRTEKLTELKGFLQEEINF